MGKGGVDKGCRDAAGKGKAAKGLRDPSTGGLWLWQEEDDKGKGKSKGKIPPEEEHGNVFVGNLPEGMGENALRQLFEGYGDIESLKVLPDKCIGFVRFSTPIEARNCIEELNNFEPVPRRRLQVSFAVNDKGMSDPNRRAWNDDEVRGGAKGVKSNIVQPGNTIFVFYVPEAWDEELLEQHFRHCGDIISTTLMRTESGMSRGYGFVNFYKPSSAHKAIIGMNGFHTAERKILKVAPKPGEEELFPVLPDYPPAGDVDAPPLMMESPPGATVFVFHLPNDWDERELHRRFIHFGSILNITVFRNGDESKGFGFVGFGFRESARRAVDGFSGFDTGTGKFLKVAFKKGEEEAAEPDLIAKLSLAEKISERRKQRGIKVPPPGAEAEAVDPVLLAKLSLAEKIGQRRKKGVVVPPPGKLFKGGGADEGYGPVAKEELHDWAEPYRI